MIRPYSSAEPSQPGESSALFVDASGKMRHVRCASGSAFSCLDHAMAHLATARDKTAAINACRAPFGLAELKPLLRRRRDCARRAVAAIYRAAFAARLGLLC